MNDLLILYGFWYDPKSLLWKWINLPKKRMSRSQFVLLIHSFPVWNIRLLCPYCSPRSLCLQLRSWKQVSTLGLWILDRVLSTSCLCLFSLDPYRSSSWSVFNSPLSHTSYSVRTPLLIIHVSDHSLFTQTRRGRDPFFYESHLRFP